MAPECPYVLGDAGSAWWAWAWGTPQASRWDAGALYTVARRARLEDDLAALVFDVSHLGAVEGAGDIAAVVALAGGKLAIEREMRELDGQLGFGAKAMAALGWKPEEARRGSKLDELRQRRERAGGSA